MWEHLQLFGQVQKMLPAEQLGKARCLFQRSRTPAPSPAGSKAWIFAPRQPRPNDAPALPQQLTLHGQPAAAQDKGVLACALKPTFVDTATCHADARCATLGHPSGGAQRTQVGYLQHTARLSQPSLSCKSTPLAKQPGKHSCHSSVNLWLCPANAAGGRLVCPGRQCCCMVEVCWRGLPARKGIDIAGNKDAILRWKCRKPA